MTSRPQCRPKLTGGIHVEQAFGSPTEAFTPNSCGMIAEALPPGATGRPRVFVGFNAGSTGWRPPGRPPPPVGPPQPQSGATAARSRKPRGRPRCLWTLLSPQTQQQVQRSSHRRSLLGSASCTVNVCGRLVTVQPYLKGPAELTSTLVNSLDESKGVSCTLEDHCSRLLSQPGLNKFPLAP